MARNPDPSESEKIDKRIRRLLASGKTVREIARVIGIPRSTAWDRVDKARGEWRVIQGRAD